MVDTLLYIYTHNYIYVYRKLQYQKRGCLQINDCVDIPGQVVLYLSVQIDTPILREGKQEANEFTDQSDLCGAFISAGTLPSPTGYLGEVAHPRPMAGIVCSKICSKQIPYHKLVGGLNPSEKNMSIGMIIPNIWENKKCSKPPTSKII